MEEELWFWETDGIYDRDGDLKAISLLWVYGACIEESMFITYQFLDLIADAYKEKAEGS